jgi:hypothetical protein
MANSAKSIDRLIETDEKFSEIAEVFIAIDEQFLVNAADVIVPRCQGHHSCWQVIVHADDVIVHAGDVIVHAGDVIVQAGDVIVHAGDVIVHAGDGIVRAGDVIDRPDRVLRSPGPAP